MKFVSLDKLNKTVDKLIAMIPKKAVDVTVEEPVLIFYQGATVSNNVLIAG